MDELKDQQAGTQSGSRSTSRTLGFLVLFLVLLTLFRDRTSQFEPGTPLDSAPLMELTTGKIIELSDLARGDKPLAVHLFATWCSVCMKEWGNLSGLAQTNAKNFRTVLVGIDSPGKIKALMRQRPVELPVYIGGAEVESSLRVHSYPYTVILSSDMRVVHDHAGVLGTRVFKKALANAESL